jgi:hypothetical protein
MNELKSEQKSKKKSKRKAQTEYDKAPKRKNSETPAQKAATSANWKHSET